MSSPAASHHTTPAIRRKAIGGVLELRRNKAKKGKPIKISGIRSPKTSRRDMPQKRERDGSIRMADDVDLLSILIVNTKYHLFVLNIKRKKPVLLETIDFLENELPLSMGVMKLDKGFFMFGGERCVDKCIQVSTLPFHRIVYDENFGVKGAMKDVYRLNPVDWTLKITEDIEKPMGPKFNPTVVKVDGKFLVLQGPSFFRSVTPHSNCEIYNPTTNTWKWLPKIPDMQHCEDISVSHGFPSYCFVGGRMYFQLNESVVYCFNCYTEEWKVENAENLQDYLDRSVPAVGLSFDKNIFLECCMEFEPGRVIANYVDDSGFLVCYQFLTELTDGIIGPCNEGMLLTDTKSGDGRMCLVLLEPEDKDSGVGYVNTFKIIHFKLKVTNRPTDIAETDGCGSIPESRKFLEVEIINDQCCILPDNVEKHGLVRLRNAFFL